jgi:hypothetical protein
MVWKIANSAQSIAVRFERYSVTVVLVCLVLWLWTFIDPALGRFEGRHFPVVEDVHVSVFAETDRTSLAQGYFHVIRPTCRFERIEWRLVGIDRYARAQVEFLEETKARPSGPNDFGPWRISASKARLEGSSVAVVYHQCPGRPYLTEPHFYP